MLCSVNAKHVHVYSPVSCFDDYFYCGVIPCPFHRLWTSGYDIFSPSVNVLNHYYVRRHYPKFWESVNRYIFVVFMYFLC